MTSPRTGNSVPNQFVIEDGFRTVFQSYDTSIVEIKRGKSIHTKPRVTLDRNSWNYSRTTSKYRNQFLNETTKETQAKIDSGEYVLGDLNV